MESRETALKPGTTAGAWFYKMDAHVRPDKLMQGLKVTLEKLGVSSKGKRAVEDGFVGCALLGGMADAAGSAPSEPMVIDT